jgi:hypothetical protein
MRASRHWASNLRYISAGFIYLEFRNRISDRISTLLHDCKNVAILKICCLQIMMSREHSVWPVASRIVVSVCVICILYWFRGFHLNDFCILYFTTDITFNMHPLFGIPLRILMPTNCGTSSRLFLVLCSNRLFPHVHYSYTVNCTPLSTKICCLDALFIIQVHFRTFFGWPRHSWSG